tara:strand:+ start:1004 stop:1408 length:405 start_codon:yes stop_codon:yes gene_type:complete
LSEAHLQSQIVKYLQLKYPKARYCASLGGQYQPYRSQRNKAKSTGYVKGFPDLGIYEAKGGYFGLFIEIKERGTATKEQKEWINDLNKRGYLASCIKGFDSISAIIDIYMSQRPTTVGSLKKKNEENKYKTISN